MAVTWGLTVFGTADDHRPYKPCRVLDLLETQETLADFKEGRHITCISYKIFNSRVNTNGKEATGKGMRQFKWSFQ